MRPARGTRTRAWATPTDRRQSAPRRRARGPEPSGIDGARYTPKRHVRLKNRTRITGALVSGLLFATCGGDTPTAPAPAPNTSAPSAPASPGQPTGIRVVDVGVDFLVWTWNPVEAATGYEAHAFPAGTPPSERPPLMVTVEPTLRADGLEPGSVMTVFVRAIRDTAGGRVFGPWSDPGTGTTLMSASTPPVTGLALPVCERTPQVRNAILAAVSLTDCSAVTTAQLQNVYELDLRDQGISSLKPEDFAGLGNLRNLNLRRNTLGALPRSVFGGLGNLSDLDLGRNSLVELPAGVFDGLDSLTALNLWSNNLVALPADVFKELGRLSRLWLSWNSLRELPAGIFDGLENLGLLGLSWNELSSLPAGLFAGLRLTSLDLEGNPGAPFRLPLTIAAETAGESTTIRVEVEHGAPFAMRIELTAVNAGLSSPVATIPVGSVMSEEITVSPGSASWSITAAGPGLPPDTWRNGNPRYEGFWIADATFTARAICSRTPQVRDAIRSALSLTGCHVVSNRQLESVSALDLSRRGIRSLNADDFTGLTGLRRLILRGNALTTLPRDIFAELADLEVLDLSGNAFDSIPEGAFTGLGTLRRLFLHDNPGSPFHFSLSIKEVARSGTRTDFRVEIDPSAPFELTIALDAENARLSSSSVTIPAGGRTSRQVSALPIGGPWSLTATAPGLPGDSYAGFEITNATFSAETAGAGEGGICNRTPEVRDAILALLPTNDCTVVTTGQLEEVSGTLNLRNRGIATLKPDDFAGLTALQTLDLEHNRLNSLPADVFDELGSLGWLWLGDNSLRSLPPDVFDSLEGLRELGLGGNRLERLPARLFRRLDNLWGLNLSRMSLRRAPQSALDALDLEKLDMSGNLLSTLPVDLFDGQVGLRSLNLSGNVLSELPTGVFDRLGDLDELDLSGNSLTTLPAGLFADLANLSELSLERNSLTTLPAGAFDGLGSLLGLSLHENSLTSLPAGAFDGLDDLRFLRLDDNSLTTLPAGVFDGLANLEALRMYRNALKELPVGVFAGLGNLRTLNVYDNSLGDLPEGVFDGLGNLQLLVISANSLSTLPDGVFDGLGNLRQVFLSENALESLREGLFQGLANLELLWLHGNPGAPFDFPLDIKEVSRAGGGTAFRVESAYGAPFPMNIELRAEGATVSTPSVTIPTGGLHSEDFTVTATGASWSVTAVGPPLPSTGFGGQYRGFIVTDGVFPPE